MGKKQYTLQYLKNLPIEELQALLESGEFESSNSPEIVVEERKPSGRTFDKIKAYVDDKVSKRVQANAGRIRENIAMLEQVIAERTAGSAAPVDEDVNGLV